MLKQHFNVQLSILHLTAKEIKSRKFTDKYYKSNNSLTMDTLERVIKNEHYALSCLYLHLSILLCT